MPSSTGVGLGRTVGGGRAGGVGQPGGRPREGGTCTGGEDRAPRGAVHPCATTPATFATGSENASSASVRALTSAGVSAG